MKNKEFYKDEIYEVACKHDLFAINKKTGEVTNCENITCDDCLFDYRENFSTLGPCDKRAMEWLEEEHVEPVLNNVEKQYLEDFIRPFRSRVKSITKRSYSNDHSYLQLGIKSIYNQDYELMNLPLFVRNKMYRRMAEEKEYTLKDLGLFENELKKAE